MANYLLPIDPEGNDTNSSASEGATTNATKNGTSDQIPGKKKSKSLKETVVKVNLTAEVSTLDLRLPSEESTKVSKDKLADVIHFYLNLLLNLF